MEEVTVDVSQQSLCVMYHCLGRHTHKMNSLILLLNLLHSTTVSVSQLILKQEAVPQKGSTHQLANILAPDLAGGRLFGHEGDAVELREEVVQTFHAGSQRQVGAVQAGLDVEPAAHGGRRRCNFAEAPVCDTTPTKRMHVCVVANRSNWKKTASV